MGEVLSRPPELQGAIMALRGVVAKAARCDGTGVDRITQVDIVGSFTREDRTSFGIAQGPVGTSVSMTELNPDGRINTQVTVSNDIPASETVVTTYGRRQLRRLGGRPMLAQEKRPSTVKEIEDVTSAICGHTLAIRATKKVVALSGDY